MSGSPFGQIETKGPLPRDLHKEIAAADGKSVTGHRLSWLTELLQDTS